MIADGNMVLRRSRGLRFGRWFALLIVVVNSVFSPSDTVAQASAGDPAKLPVTTLLTNVQQVLSLGAYRARQTSQPVHLRGTILELAPKWQYLFLHDETGCILVTVTNLP